MALMLVLDDTRGRGRCRSCQAEVTWFELTSGRRHPFDGDPTYARTFLDADRRLVGEIDTTVSKSHFATCPQAKDWRRK